ncbi:Checkpoint protein [Lachnellula occidentalis]|uniref:Checkpoint protein n=1 Tax=Lachnellula occidentalis TaxID=215460 RepID=A0A8H8RPN9_9HELO|nr:Checkpoint protein [Lachnellula occidentalis]
MRFKTSIRNIQTFSRLTTSLSSLGKVAWVRLDDDSARFTIIPETGTQVWALYHPVRRPQQHNQPRATPPAPKPRPQISPKRIIRLDPPHQKKTEPPGNSANGFLSNSGSGSGNQDPFGDNAFREENLDVGRDREAIVTQDIPVRVLQADSVEGIHEPKVREPDAYIVLPSLIQLKAISDRFIKLTSTSTSTSASKASPKLELAANMHGGLKLRVETDALNIESVWTGLTNPDLDPGQVEGGLEELPSARLKARGPDAWARVRIDGRDWGKVLSVGRMDGRVIACFADENALILYVYLSNYDDGEEHSVLTYYISSFSA